MKKQFHVSKNDNEDLGFAQSCLFSSIISFDEFLEWLYLVIDTNEEVPVYIYDILECKCI